jgi:hypothetical protein
MKTLKTGARYLLINRLVTLVIGMILVSFQTGCQESQPLPTPTKIPSSIREWDYVALGDTRTASADWPERYAEYIEADLANLGISVTVHNWASGEQTSEGLLALIQDTPILRDQIRKAEVITLWTGGHTVREMLTNHNIACDPELVEAFGHDMKKILAQIISLRSQNPTIIRLLEFYQPRVNILRGLGILEEKNLCLSAFNQRLHEVAEIYQIPVARTHHAFNGLDGNSDAMESGYLNNPYDISAAGNERIASLLQELGYQQYLPKYSVFRFENDFPAFHIHQIIFLFIPKSPRCELPDLIRKIAA